MEPVDLGLTPTHERHFTPGALFMMPGDTRTWTVASRIRDRIFEGFKIVVQSGGDNRILWAWDGAILWGDYVDNYKGGSRKPLTPEESESVRIRKAQVKAHRNNRRINSINH